MAKVSGQLHSDLAKGSVGPVTHRIYRGTGTASKHRAPSRKRLTKLWIKSPVDIPGCWSRFVAGIGYTLRTVGVDNYLKYLLDQVGGFGTLTQLVDGLQPKWFPSDPAHGNQPYILPDGIDDFIQTGTISPFFDCPLEIWIVASTAGSIVGTKVLTNFSNNSDMCFAYSSNPAARHYWKSPTVNLLAPELAENVCVWRLVLTQYTIQVFINNVAQTAPKATSPMSFRNFRLFTQKSGSYPWAKRLFEIDFYRRILNPVEVQLLHSYFYDLYDLP